MTEQEMRFYCGEIRRLKQELKALKSSVHPLLREVKDMTVALIKGKETTLAQAWIDLIEPVEKALKRKARK